MREILKASENMVLHLNKVPCQLSWIAAVFVFDTCKTQLHLDTPITKKMLFGLVSKRLQSNNLQFKFKSSVSKFKL